MTEKRWLLNSQFLQAVQEADCETIDALLNNGFDIDSFLMSRKTAIHVCIERENLAMAQLLIKRGCSLSLRTDKGDTALHIAAKHSNYELVKLLLENRADMSRLDSNGKTVLHYCCSMQSPTIAALLISMASPALINVRDSQGMTPLMYACRYGTINEIDALLKKKARVNVSNNLGASPLSQCLHNPLCSVEMVLLLLDAGASLKGADNSIETPLLDACRCALYSEYSGVNKFHDLCVIYIERGCDVNARDSLGESALHLAVLLQDHLLILKLLNFGADVNVLNSVGYTPLIYAIRKDSRCLVNLLLNAGASFTPNNVKFYDLMQLSEVYRVNTSPRGEVMAKFMYALRKTLQCPPLSNLCRLSIRKHLQKNKEWAASQLPLPPSLIRFILLID